jgi:predicted phage-related endonuclease
MKPVPLAGSSLDRADRIQRLLGLVSLGTALVATLMTATFTFFKSPRVDPLGQQPSVELHRSQKALEADIEAVRTQLKTVQVDMQKIVALPADAKLAVQISQMEEATKGLGSRLDRLEAAILQSPAKALEIPLLQRDLENLRTAQQTNLQAVKDGVDRLYDINKWLLGAMAISIITLALSNFLRPRDTGNKKE